MDALGSFTYLVEQQGADAGVAQIGPHTFWVDVPRVV